MPAPLLHFNPFAQLLSPVEVLEALRESLVLNALRSEIHRPLDRPFLSCIAELVQIDADIDAEIDVTPDDNFDDAILKSDTSTRWG